MAKNTHDVDININGRNLADRAFRDARKSAVDFQRQINSMGASLLGSVFSVGMVSAAVGTLARKWEESIKAGDDLRDTVAGIGWAQTTEDIVSAIPYVGQFMQAGKLLNAEHRDALRIQGETERMLARLTKQQQRAAQQQRMRIALTQQQQDAQRRLNLALAQSPMERLNVQEAQQREDIQEQFRRQREQAHTRLGTTPFIGEALQQLAQAEADALAAIAAEFNAQRQQMRQQWLGVFESAEGRLGQLQLQIDTATLRESGQHLEAQILEIQHGADSAAESLWQAAQQSAATMEEAWGNRLLEWAEEEKRRVLELAQLRIAAARREDETRRRSFEQMVEDELAQARIESLRSAVLLGDESRQLDLEKLQIMREEERRRQRLAELLRDERLDAERKLEIEQAIARSRDMERRRIEALGVGGGDDIRGGPEAPAYVQARSARFLTRSSPFESDASARLEQHGREMVKINRDMLRQLQEAKRELEELNRNSIVLAEAES